MERINWEFLCLFEVFIFLNSTTANDQHRKKIVSACEQHETLIRFQNLSWRTTSRHPKALGDTNRRQDIGTSWRGQQKLEPVEVLERFFGLTVTAQMRSFGCEDLKRAMVLGVCHKFKHSLTICQNTTNNQLSTKPPNNQEKKQNNQTAVKQPT